jgi:heterotetrameric sarcosine oxidase gamma subunit
VLLFVSSSRYFSIQRGGAPVADPFVSRHEAGILQFSAFAGQGEAATKFIASIDGEALGVSSAVDVIEIAPFRWWMLFEAERPGLESLPASTGAIVDLSSSRVRVALRHPRWRAVLAKGCGVDLTGRHFTARRYAMTALGHYNVLLRALGDAEGCDVYVGRSLVQSLENWLSDSMLEFERG